MNDYDTDTAAILSAAVLIVLAAWLFITAADAIGGQPTAQGCYSARLWTDDDGDRPCARLNLYEDGSYRVKVREADGDKWRAR